MASISDKLQHFIKHVLLQLSTNTKIDHRNYAARNKNKKSPLVKSIEACSNSFDNGIALICDKISRNQEFMSLIQKFTDLHTRPNDNGDEDNCDEIYETEIEIFDMFINLVGLNEINSLHGDDVDKFRENLCVSLLPSVAVAAEINMG